MKSTELKTQLIERINEIEDVEFLEAIKTILESKTVTPYMLSESQKEGIEMSREPIKNGDFFLKKKRFFLN